MSAILMKKLSAKGIMGKIIAPPVGETVEQFTVIGYAKSYTVKDTTFGDSTAFHGSFKATNVQTGESFQASTLYLPDVASDLLQNELDNVAEDATVEFGFIVSIAGVVGKSGETDKYEYRCAPLMEASENDPLALLQSRLASGDVKQLAAPTSKPAPAKAKGKK